jgi:diguanylate cyclase
MRQPQTGRCPAHHRVRRLAARGAARGRTGRRTGRPGRAGGNSEGATPALADAVADVCHRARRLFAHRHQLVDELLALCHSLTDGPGRSGRGPRAGPEGQAEGCAAPAGPAGARAVRAARELLAETRDRPAQRCAPSVPSARDAFKDMVRQVLAELGELGRRHRPLQRQGGRLCRGHRGCRLARQPGGRGARDARRDRTVHEVVAGARDRMADRACPRQRAGIARAGLEAELRRLSDEVSTDALTQVANRRGLAQAFTPRPPACCVTAPRRRPWRWA